MDRIRRLNIINSITGIKPANLIGTKSKDGQPNVAIFSSVIHLGSDPALIGFIMRPVDTVPKHTYDNIRETGIYTINHVNTSILAQAHYTSAKVDRAVSEFEKCGLTEEYLADFHAPYVKECHTKIGLQLMDEVPIELNGTRLMIGEIKHLHIPDQAVDEQGYLDLGLHNTAGISGLNSYYSVQRLASYPYARPDEIPDFSRK